MQQRIGILGGSFNPIHLGHLNIACAARDRLRLSKVLFLPCKVSPFKTASSPESFINDSHRLKMIELSIEGYESFELSLMEIERGGISYSYDTVSRIRKKYPDSEIFFIIGADTRRTLSEWYRIHALLNMCEFVTVNRPGVEDMSSVPGLSAEENRRLAEYRITGRLFDISSSEIRRKIAEGKSVKQLVSPDVEKYIQRHGLYGS
ncbi:MAG: nicotinate-nucleotide adenylyltransferase [Kiritimatiellia bacterium]